MSNEIQLYDRFTDPMDAISRLGEFFARSGMFGCQRDEQGKVLAMACMCDKKNPIAILREYHLIDGKLCDRADSMLAKLRGKGGKHKVIKRDADEASLAITYEGETREFKFTWKEAQEEPFPFTGKTDGDGNKILKKNWATPRARMQMLWARCVSDAVRTMAPEIVAGIYTPEEVEDQPITVEAKPLLPEQPTASKPEPIVVPEAPPIRPVTPTPAPPPPDTSNADLNPAPAIDPLSTPEGIEQAILNVLWNGEQDAEKRITLADKAIKWCETKGWIKPLETLKQVSRRNAEKVIAKPDKWREAVLG